MDQTLVIKINLEVILTHRIHLKEVMVAAHLLGAAVEAAAAVDMGLGTEVAATEVEITAMGEVIKAMGAATKEAATEEEEAETMVIEMIDEGAEVGAAEAEEEVMGKCRIFIYLLLLCSS